jgi:copper chaperone CopZ
VVKIEIKLKTEGMHCTSCEALVKDSLEELDGINKVDVSYQSGIVDVDFDEKEINRKKIIEVIEKEGYKIRK